MIHQLSYSVYQDLSVFGSDPVSVVASMGFDSVEMLTSYDRPGPSLRDICGSVHLPYAVDWLAAWEGHALDLPEDSLLYHSYGRNRDDVVSNIRTAIEAASVLDPPYMVFHACNADTPEIMRRTYTRSDADVVRALCEMLNDVVSSFPGGEPPSRILLENLWWPGLRLLDDSGFRILERNLEFDDWGINLDTGHLMSCLPVSTEEEAIEALERVFDRYPSDMIDRIDAVHIHWSATWSYRSSFEEHGYEPPFEDFIRRAYAHVSMMDRHLPFTDSRCTALVEMLYPKTITHETPGSVNGFLEDSRAQRSLFSFRFQPMIEESRIRGV